MKPRTSYFAPEGVQISTLPVFVLFMFFFWPVLPIFDFFAKMDWLTERLANGPTDQQTDRQTKQWMDTKGGQKSPFFMNTISLYYIPLQDNLGIIFSKFGVPSINDGSHRGKWILANPFKIAKFQIEKSSVLTLDLSRSWKSTIWKCLSFLKIPSGSASKMHLKM